MWISNMVDIHDAKLTPKFFITFVVFFIFRGFFNVHDCKAVILLNRES